MPANFNHIAPYYDGLAKIIFGNKLQAAKKVFLHKIPAGGSVLLMGEGTGTLLTHLLRIDPALNMDYIDPSIKMLELARKKIPAEYVDQVQFIAGTHQSIPPQKKYDAVLAFFVIDCMQQQEAMEFVHSLTVVLKQDGCLLMADFFLPRNLYQRLLLWLMYRFFSVVAAINTTSLPDYDSLFNSIVLAEEGRHNFMKGFIQSRYYRKR